MHGHPLRHQRLAVAGTSAIALVVLAGPAWADDNGDQGDGRRGGAAQSEPTHDAPDEGDNRHPSGRDRSVEAGRSGSQGRSESDPDGTGNGGADKPGGPGGVDRDDQDGNNGCGNDDDFEDDNNGNCGGLAEGVGAPVRPAVVPPEVLPAEARAVTVGRSRVSPAAAEVLALALDREQVPPAEVLGAGAQRLPFTGTSPTALAAIATGLLLAGTTSIVVAGRRTVPAYVGRHRA